MEDFFRQLAEDAPRWNFIWMYEERQQNKILAGLWMTIKLSIACLIFSVIIGLVGAWMQGAKSRVARAFVQGYIQFFRNTPPMVQLLFFYFALGQFTPVVTGPDGWTVQPIISKCRLGDHLAKLLCRRLQCRDLPRRDRGGARKHGRGL